MTDRLASESVRGWALALYTEIQDSPRFGTDIIEEAILQARSQAYEECANIAGAVTVPSEYSSSWQHGFRAGHASVSQAIRQHSQKGEDK
jgi:hypothetical protein